MREGIFISAGLHVGMIAVAIVGLPTLLDPDPPQDVQIIMEVVTVDESQIEKPMPKMEPMEPAKDAPIVQPEAPALPPPAARPVPPPPAQPQVAALPPEPAPKPEMVPAPKPETIRPVLVPPVPKPITAKPAEAPAPKPETAVEPKPQPAKKVVRGIVAPRRKPPPPPTKFESMLRDLEERRVVRERTVAKATKDRDEMPQLRRPELPERRQQSMIRRQRIIAALVQRIQTQVRPCWNPPIGAKDAHEIRVGVRIMLNPDGTLIGRPYIVDQDRLFRDPAFQAFAESARRALQNPRCSPLRLPLATYETWREISFNFDTTELLQ